MQTSVQTSDEKIPGCLKTLTYFFELRRKIFREHQDVDNDEKHTNQQLRS